MGGPVGLVLEAPEHQNHLGVVTWIDERCSCRRKTPLLVIVLALQSTGQTNVLSLFTKSMGTCPTPLQLPSSRGSRSRRLPF